MSEFTGYTAAWEMKSIFIEAKNKLDAEKILREQVMNSQDRLVSLEGVKQGYEARYQHLIARDWPSGYNPK